jgi:hypothetical protein
MLVLLMGRVYLYSLDMAKCTLFWRGLAPEEWEDTFGREIVVVVVARKYGYQTFPLLLIEIEFSV